MMTGLQIPCFLINCNIIPIMKVIAHQPPLKDNDSIAKLIDLSIRSVGTDTTEEWIAAYSSNEDESAPSDDGSDSSSTTGCGMSHSDNFNNDNNSFPSNQFTTCGLELRSADSSGRLPLLECHSQTMNRKLYSDVTAIVKSLSEDEEVKESRQFTACGLEQRSMDSSERISSQECPNEVVKMKLYFDVTAIVKSLSEDEEVKASRRFFSRSKNTNIRSSSMADSSPTEEESFSELGSSCYWRDDTSCTSSIDNLSIFLPGDSPGLSHDKQEDDGNFSLSREFQEDDLSFCCSIISVDHRSSHSMGEAASASRSLSYQQQLDDSQNEEVYYDEPSPFIKPDEVDLQITEELVERLDLLVTSLEMLLSQLNIIHHEEDSCHNVADRREHIISRRTQPLLTLRISQMRRARRHVVDMVYGGATCTAIPPDIRHILGMVQAPSQLGPVPGTAGGQCFLSARSSI